MSAGYWHPLDEKFADDAQEQRRREIERRTVPCPECIRKGEIPQRVKKGRVCFDCANIEEGAL